MGKIEFSGASEIIRHSAIVLREEGLDRFLLYGIYYLCWKLQFRRAVQSLPVSLATAVYRLIKTLVRRKVKILNRLYPNKYTDADPYKRIFVDPNSIEYTTGEIFSRRRGWVVDGDWDTVGDLYMQRTFATAIEQRFGQDFDWEETVLAERYNTEIKNRGKKIDHLYQHIRDNGYKSQQQLLKQSPETAWTGLNDAIHPLANEIGVDIGRNGEFLWNICGQHRLAIAKVLNIDRIPVQVFRRHTEWQQIRDRVRKTDNVPDKFCNHPDLYDILDSDDGT